MVTRFRYAELPKLPNRRTRRMIIRHARKNPLMAANLVIFMAFGLLSWYLIQAGYIHLPVSWQAWLSKSTGPGGVLAPSPGSALAPGPAARIAQPCKIAPSGGNTLLELIISGGIGGSSVAMTGHLHYTNPHTQVVIPVPNAHIDIYDALSCTVIYTATTRSDGYYSYERPLQADELNGYNVFAYYNGEIWNTSMGTVGAGPLSAANTGIWYITPQGGIPAAPQGSSPTSAVFNPVNPMPSATATTVPADEVIAAFEYIVDQAQKNGNIPWPYGDNSLPDHEADPQDTLNAVRPLQGQILSIPPDYVAQYWHSRKLIGTLIGTPATARRVLYL